VSIIERLKEIGNIVDDWGCCNPTYFKGFESDLENIKLPGRLVSANSCPFQYRGEGCCYEFNSRRNTDEHGEEAILPEEAPPVMTQFNEYISDLLSGIPLTDFGAYDSNRKYNSGNYVFLEHNNIKYYFVGNGIDITTAPPNINYWISDSCAKNIQACEARYALDGSAKGNITLGNVPFGGFSAVTRFK